MYNIYCINLDIRPDRWELSKKIFNHPKINLIRFPGILKKNGKLGCAKSHINLIEKYFKEENLIVIEDDCMIRDDIEIFIDKLDKIINFLNEKYLNWDVFNGNPTYINNDIKIINLELKLIQCNGKTANFMIYNIKNKNKIMTEILNYKLLISKIINKMPYDRFTKNNLIMITLYPYLTYQKSSYSNILEKNTNYLKFFNISENKIYNIIKNESSNM